MRYAGIALIAISLIISGVGSAEVCGGAEEVACCSDVSSTDGTVCAIPANNRYEFTLRRFGFEDSTGQITFAGNQQTFDAASALIGRTMGVYVSGATLPPGRYVAVRPEVGLEMTVNGSGVSTTDGVACTSGGNVTGNLGTILRDLGDPIPSCSTSPLSDCDTGDGFIRVRDTQLGAFDIGPGKPNRVIRFQFDVGSGVLFDASGGNCSFRSMGLLDVKMRFRQESSRAGASGS